MTEMAETAARVAGRTSRWPLACWYWGDAIAVDGLLAVDDAGLAPARGHVLALLQRWLEFTPVAFSDVLAPGAAIVRLVGEGALSELALERFLDAVDRLPLLVDDVPVLEPHLARYRFGVCIDAVYHLPPALAAAGRLRRDPALAERAVLISRRVLDLLRCPGGWAQWFDVTRGRNNSVVWSRGVGWALLGILDTVGLADGLVDPGPLNALAEEMLELLDATQDRSGHWTAVLGRPDLPLEMSVAPFYLAGALHPQAGAIPGGRDALGRATRAFWDSLDADGVLQGVSADVLPDWDPVSYETFTVEPSPWGQGAALRALAALSLAADGQPLATSAIPGLGS